MSVTFSVENTTLEMNVATGSAAIILFELLGFGRDEVGFWGNLDPADVLRRLSTSTYKVPSLVRPSSESQGVFMDANGVGLGCRVIESGYSADRIMRYATTLQLMAEQAQAMDEVISYS